MLLWLFLLEDSFLDRAQSPVFNQWLAHRDVVQRKDLSCCTPLDLPPSRMQPRCSVMSSFGTTVRSTLTRIYASDMWVSCSLRQSCYRGWRGWPSSTAAAGLFVWEMFCLQSCLRSSYSVKPISLKSSMPPNFRAFFRYP